MDVKTAIQIYRVGGYVRDKLLGIESNDCDYVVVGSTPDEMLKKGFERVGKSFPVFLASNGDEYALARREVKNGKGYIGFDVDTYNVTLEEDLRRRDLTINAIAEDFEGNLIDPFGGVEDIKNRVLRHVSKAFSEDPVRVLRVARLKASLPVEFSIADETAQLIKEMALSGELKHLQKERVRAEVIKTVYRGNIYIFLKTLDDLGVLSEIFPYIKDYSILEIREIKSFPKLVAILSLSNPVQEICDNLVIAKNRCRASRVFRDSVKILNNPTNPEAILKLFRINRIADTLKRNLKFYNYIYPENMVDIEKLDKFFRQYRGVGRSINNPELSKAEKGRLVKERQLELIQKSYELLQN